MIQNFNKVNDTVCSPFSTNLSKTIDNYIDSYHDKHNCSDGMNIEDGEIYQTIIIWWLDGFFHVIICSVGVIANLLSIPVLLSKKLRNLFNITLAILAVFDAIYTFSDLLESLRAVHYSHTTCAEVPFYQQMHLNLVPVLSMINGASMMASIYTTIIISLERYVAVSKPMNSYVGYFEIVQGEWKNALLYTMPTALFSVLFSLPKYFEFSIKSYKELCRITSNNGMETGTEFYSYFEKFN